MHRPRSRNGVPRYLHRRILAGMRFREQLPSNWPRRARPSRAPSRPGGTRCHTRGPPPSRETSSSRSVRATLRPVRRPRPSRRRTGAPCSPAKPCSSATPLVFDVLVSARSQPAGIALSDRAAGPRTQALLRLLGVPAVVDLQGLFRWAADGDVALLDGDHGLFVINPSKSEMAGLREHRRADRAKLTKPTRLTNDEGAR